MGELRDSMASSQSGLTSSQSHIGRVRSFLNNSDYREIDSVPLIFEGNMTNEAFDFLKKRRDFKLSHKIWQKRFFEPSKREDVLEYKYFLENNRWRTNCPFILEWPYLTMTDMIRSQLIEHYIEKMASDAE